MSEAKHTPGPWIVFSEPTAPYYVKGAEVYAGDVMICGHILGRAESDGDGLKPVAGEREANARLIAAAPELLELAEAYRVYDTPQQTHNGAALSALHRRVMAKVRGEARQ